MTDPGGGDVVFGEGQVVTVFRSRRRPAAESAYQRMALEMEAAARAMPGFVDFKTFVAEDGEQVSVVTFGSPAAHRAWRDDPRHRRRPAAGSGRLLSRVLRAGRGVHALLGMGP